MRFFTFKLVIILKTITALGGEVDIVDNIWIEGTSFYQSIEKGKTVYFSEWEESITDILHDNDYAVALQLDQFFDPLPQDQLRLPTLTSLAAIHSDSLLSEYFLFLEHFGRTKGVDYMILPEVRSLNSLEQRVVELASEKSPFYFLKKSIINKYPPESKKEYLASLDDEPKIWLVSKSEETKKIYRWDSKYLGEKVKRFYTQVNKAKEQGFTPTHYLPKELKESIFVSATFAVDNNYHLPINADSICYIGNDEKLINWLNKYTQVFEHRVDGIPAIVDNRLVKNPLEEGDIVITDHLLESGHEVAQIVLPIDIENGEIILAKMLFGASAISGNHEAARIISNQHYLGHSDLLIEGISENLLRSIDSLGTYAIKNYATPGLQVAVIKNGSLVYQTSKGHYTYDSIKKVDEKTLYDLASLTKVMATLPAIALLVDQELIHLDDSISTYLPEFIGSNKSHVTIKQLLAHNGGLKSYVPFWKMILEGDRMDPFYYKSAADEANDIRTYGYQPDPVLLDTLNRYIIQSELIKNPSEYNYSDLGFMVLHLIVEQVTQMPFDEFLNQEFYHPMGLTNTTFNPIENGFRPEEITPTEYDNRFRNYQVWGEVHDRNAMVFGGVAGHAGLFSNSTDLAKMMCMYLNNGYYGGKRYLTGRVLELFNTKYFDDNRRGLGWDKKDEEHGAGSKYASKESFGHTGFTGTMVWADPEEDLIFIFLSNRIYPDAKNNRLGRYKTRTLIHDAVYQSVIRKESLKLN